MSPQRSMTANPARRMKRKTLYVLATCVSMLVYALLLVLSGGQSWLVWPALGAMLLGMAFAALWMGALDEAAQQAHYIAWFWGGCAGLLVSMLTFVAVVLRPEAFEPLLSELGVSASFAAGIAAGVVPPAIGYGILWAVVWLRRG